MRLSNRQHKSQLHRRFRYSPIHFLCVFLVFLTIGSAAGSAETRTLRLYYINTGEKTEITFKRNGKYIASGLKKLDNFLRDWRRKESTKMDPKLYDLVWEVHKETGSKNRIHVVSAYRSPATNAMLRRTRGGQAKKSQHMVGRAMDFYIPGVKSSKLRAIGLKKGWGGVGYYPRSNSPYVHMDTGRVRHWPRMTRKQLVALFPNGRTLHVPTDGKPLKNYKLAQADYRKFKAGKPSPTTSSGGGGLLAALGIGADDNEDKAESNVPVPREVRTNATAGATLPAQTNDKALPIPDATLPVQLPITVAAPRINPLNVTPVEKPANSNENEILIATALPPVPVVPEVPPAQTLKQEPVEELQNQPITVTQVVPRSRPIQDIIQPDTEKSEISEDPIVTEQEQSLVAALPQSRSAESIAQDELVPASQSDEVIQLAQTDQPVTVEINSESPKPSGSNDYASRVSDAHQVADLPSDLTLLSGLQQKTAIIPNFEDRPDLIAVGSTDDVNVLTDDIKRKFAQKPTQIAALPQPRPEIIEVEPEKTDKTNSEDPIEIAAIPSTRPEEQAQSAREQIELPSTDVGSGTQPSLVISDPQIAVASTNEFTPDGRMAIGQLNGATVLGWAIAPLDPLGVEARGLRAPAYGQNALRAAPMRASQRALDAAPAQQQWTLLQKEPLRLARLN